MITNKTLLLTACISPSGMSYTELQDPKLREAQYLNALKWYLSNTPFIIILCENTNYHLPKEFDSYIISGRLEYLTFYGNSNFDRSRGKGVGELQIIKYALKNSKLIQSADCIMKMTGRQVLTNINFIAKICSNRKCVYANLTKQNLGIMAAYSQFFICPKEFFEQVFFKGIDKLDDSRFYYFEHLLFDSIQIWKNDNNGVFSEFWMPLIINGYSGSTNKKIPTKSHPWTKSIILYFMHKCGIYVYEPSPVFSDDQIKKIRDIDKKN